jgi:hypothetical protein
VAAKPHARRYSGGSGLNIAEDEEQEVLRHLVGDLLLLAERELRAAQALVHENHESDAAKARFAAARRAMDTAHRCATYLTRGLPILA